MPAIKRPKPRPVRVGPPPPPAPHPLEIEINSLRDSLVTVRAAYAAANARYNAADTAIDPTARRFHFAEIDRWNYVDRAICAAIHRMTEFHRLATFMLDASRLKPKTPK